jgi:hypothetical protein
MNTESNFTVLQTVAKIIVENNSHTSVMCGSLKWLNQFETCKDALGNDTVKKSGAFLIKPFGILIAVPKTEVEFKSNIEPLAEAIALYFSHCEVENRVVASHPFSETFKQFYYPDLMRKVSNKEYTQIL